MQIAVIIERAVAAIQQKSQQPCKIGLILGSGLGDYAETLEDRQVIPYSAIEGHPQSSVPGHKGQYVIGSKGGKRVIAMQGRFHLYEGYPPQMLMIGVRIMKRLGVTHLIITNAAGGVNKEDTPGTILLLADHVNYSGVHPLIGANDDSFGPRFPDMSDAYDRQLRARAKEVALELGISLKEAVYMMFSGPTYETPAEIRMARAIGADAVGMSTVPEVIAAAHCGIRVLAFSVITNHAAGVADQKLCHEEVQQTANMIAEKFSTLITAAIEKVCP